MPPLFSSCSYYLVACEQARERYSKTILLAVSMRKGEQIVGHVPRELPMPLEEESKEMDWKYHVCTAL